MTLFVWRGAVGSVALAPILTGLLLSGSLLAGPLLLGSGCGTDDPGGDAGSDALTDEAGQTEARPFDGDLPHNLGAACEQAGECELGSPLCLVFDVPTSRGVCTASCTLDKPSTPDFNEDSCPLGFACAALAEEAGFCLKTCRPSLTKNPCPEDVGQICDPESATLLPTGRRPVCWFMPCESGRSCPVLSDKSCTEAAECAYLGEDGFCEPNERLCALPGNCTPAGICGPHDKGSDTARPGQPCKDDFECPHGGFCIPETTGEDGVVSVRNGYCTISNCAFSEELPGFECGADATCYYSYVAGLCFATCDLDEADQCRGLAEGEGAAGDKGGDYECYSVEGFTARDGIPAASEPICIASRACDGVNASTGCAALGLEDNPTDMKCRDRATGVVKDDPADSDGVCLDNTASGGFDPAPDAGVGDDA